MFSFVSLGLFLLLVGVGSGIVYAGYRMFRSAQIGDEESERRLAQEEAKRAEELAAKYPGKDVGVNKDKLDKLRDRSL